MKFKMWETKAKLHFHRAPDKKLSFFFLFFYLKQKVKELKYQAFVCAAEYTHENIRIEALRGV